MDTTEEDIALNLLEEEEEEEEQVVEDHPAREPSIDVDAEEDEDAEMIEDPRNPEDDPWQKYFTRSSTLFPWTVAVREQIETRRAKLSDCLLFDSLLRLGRISDPASLYPPADTEGLRRLVNAIRNCSWDRLKRDCLLYYLLLFYQDTRADEFAYERVVPPPFLGVASAYWCLDNTTDIPRAISYLSDARVQRNDVSKIMEALSLESKANSYIRQYVRTVRPHLMAPKDINIYVIALADSSLLEAWQYQRSFLSQSEMRDTMIRKILQWMLTPEPRPVPLTQLLSFPLNSFEEAILQDFCLRPPENVPAKSIPIIQDLICVRLVRAGNYATAIKLDRQFSAGVLGHHVEGDSVAQKMARERRKMLDELLSLMPEIERQILEEELEALSLGKGKSANGDATSRRKSRKSTTTITPENLGRNDNLFVPTKPAERRTIWDNLKLPPAPPPIPLSRPTAVAEAGPSGMKYGNGLFGLGKPNSPMVLPGNSLFNKTGSANKAPNAFYDPSKRRPLKRSPERRYTPMNLDRPPTPPSLALPKDLPAENTAEEQTNGQLPLPATEPSQNDKDVAMVSASDIAKEQSASVQQDEPPANEFSASIFAPSRPSTSNSLSASLASSRGSPKRADKSLSESQRRALPGAFDPDETIDTPSPEPEPSPEQLFFRSSHGSEQSHASAAAMFNGARSPSPSPPVSPTPPPSKRTRGRNTDHNPTPTKRQKEEADLSRSIPGSYTLEELEDDVPPLPASPRKPSRKGRSSRASSDEDESSFRPRRSTRLSAASSVGSITSPDVQRQKGRANMQAATNGSRTRRKR